ncbi:PICOT family protein [Aspergillus aculeatinus CBS 121060]|uniref:Monothiol glutaredoxin-4 n=1 Tax=Aspergillus aculeatinus CBS 121060 TaxID=1448322 RepID=A0ACD1HKF5_9EURO|nr:monothiol glutaredoxin-4 [Aspergillus aculeatinus CBS 121060]RAH73900.1 monothiol glutaredoxin-4 [Aspergillus aculeatinus CBS 121060]
MSALIEVATEAEFPTYLSSLPPTCLLVLYFHAPWAAPCTQMRAVLSALASQYPATSPPTTAFLSVNAEELPDISEDYDVTAVPFVVLVRDGQILESISGSEAVRVRDAVERYAGAGSNTTQQPQTQQQKTAIPPPLTAVPREDASAPTTATQAPNGATGGGAAAGPAATAETKEALFARLAELVKAAPVMLFMKGTPSAPQCGFSRQLVGILRERSVKYGFFNILADEDVRQGLKEFADWPTFPQLWVDGELVGGLDIVKEELENDPDFLAAYSVNKAV